MFWLVFVSLYNVLCYSTLLVPAHCGPVISIGTVSISGSEENLLKSLEEHDHRMEKMIKNIYSAVETALSRSIARGQEEYFKGFKKLYYNMSDENFPKTLENLKPQEEEEYLRSLKLNLTSMIVKADERIQSLNEKLTFIFQSLSSTLQTVNKTLGENVQGMEEQCSSFMNGSIVCALREHYKKLQTMNETFSSAFDKINEKLNVELNSVLDHVNERFYDIKTQVCPSGFEYLSGAGACYRVIFQSLDWYNSSQVCKSVMSGVHLAAITSAEKQQAIKNYLVEQFKEPESSACLKTVWPVSGKSVWISGQTKDPRRCTPYFWKTLNAVEIPFNYTNWLPNQPDCYGKAENCAHIAVGRDFGWNDFPCNGLTCALCEF